MNRSIDVVIVGGGAAGLTAAHFLVRAGLSVEIVDQDRSILKRARLLNLPGHDEIEGRDLLESLQTKCAEVGAAITIGKVIDVNAGDRFTVTLSEGVKLSARYVVLATGQGALNLPSLPLVTDAARQPFVKLNIRTDKWGATSVPGVWAAGVAAGWPSQAVVCAGSGAAVAVEIASLEKGEFWVDHDTTKLANEPE